jgi:hypothetical protein
MSSGDVMHADAFQVWKADRDAIEAEMNKLISTGIPPSAFEREIRRVQFATLIERRDASARTLLRALRGDHSPAPDAAA